MTDRQADHSLADWTTSLSSKQPTPGGGAAAAVAASLAVALGAMAARYTTGKKWADRQDEAKALAAALDLARDAFLQTADRDVAAYAGLQASWRDPDMREAEKQQIAAEALAVPMLILQESARFATQLVQFLPKCNPQIRSDALAALHLLAGAGRAAWQTVMINKPDADAQAEAKKHLAVLAAADSTGLNRS